MHIHTEQLADVRALAEETARGRPPIDGGAFYDPAGLDVAPHELGLWCAPVPAYSTEDSVALAALERYCEKHGTWWTIARSAGGRYIVALHCTTMAYASGATTLAHAIVRAVLAAKEER